MAMACSQMMTTAMLVVVMVGIVAAAPPSHVGGGEKLDEEATLYECCPTDDCGIVSGTFEPARAELLMLGQWRGCETEAAGLRWCIQLCQAGPSESCFFATQSSGNCSYLQFWGTWTEIPSSAAAMETARRAAALTSPRTPALIRALIAAVEDTASA